MNIFKLSIANLRYNGIGNAFNILILALGIALIVMLLHVSEQVEDRFERDLSGIDLVVGAKGSPIDLILSSVFHLGVPNGNIPLGEAQKVEKNPLVKSAIPVALGDSYHGFRIVGTTPGYAKHYDAEFAEGAFWTKPMQAVLGSEVARASGLNVGEHFVGTHGLTAGGEEHSQFPYEVVGILKPTGSVIDRLALTDVASVWQVHAHHDPDDHDEDEGHHGREVTSLLISYKTPLAAASLPRLINKTSSMMAASPAFETAQLVSMLGIGGDTIQLFACVLVGIAAIGFFVTLLGAVNDRQYDIALMRALGATRGKVFAFVLMEGLTLGIGGTILGLVLGHLFAHGAQCWIETTRHMTLRSVGIHALEPYIVLGALGISVVAAIIPAIMAYRINVAHVLSKGS